MVGYGSDKGIIPRASEVIFERIDASTSGVTFKVEASMMEIYNEKVKGASCEFVPRYYYVLIGLNLQIFSIHRSTI